MRLIGLNGRRGSGKDQTFKYINNIAVVEGYTAERVAFADKLKISAMRALGYNGPEDSCVGLADQIKQDGTTITTVYEQPEGTPRALKISGRQFLQLYGTEAHRDVFGTNFWIDAVLPTPGLPMNNQGMLQTRYPGVDILVVTDVRFSNEAQRVLDLGGEMWLIDRPSAEIGDAHTSELALPAELITRVIKNDSNLSVLANRVSEALHT